ncbi:FGGY carbohydrate kinase domain-containing protein isoform X1 [Schistocerca gregaria]|uniref:FGGY carbohydrate kinase domain-containing protein isoform X1 n=2 Tax=Schistocerca gregaria TaxID=7010 RepID=UPI00211E6BEF|nr:FGGY carbohydrate kinase domain-containing protein isoform X1 [Schistocerca gregaria]
MVKEGYSNGIGTVMGHENLFVGVDVGTGSVRAALVSEQGKLLNVSTKPIKTWTPKKDFFEQSSDDIWSVCCHVVKAVTQDIEPAAVKGIGFDATCSLVVLDKTGNPLSVSPTGNNEQNIILWMDHRAIEEADLINSLKNPVLNYVGGKISLEMETPKLLWLKKNLKSQCWDKAGYFFDLPDFLTWKATDSESRSLCSLVCKWTYQVQADGMGSWSSRYFTEIGLDDLITDNWRKIGSEVKPPGAPSGNGLSRRAAADLGLLPGTAVGTSMIDAHAGGLGMIGCSADGVSQDFHTRLGLICGTSTCHMAVSKLPYFVPGVWGPYFSAMVPGLWLNEGGQSATGKLIDHIIDTHPATDAIKEKIGDTLHVQEYLNNLLEKMAQKQELKSVAMLTCNVHMWPDFHGNRSPLADPSLQGMISGLTLSVDEENLATLYLATIQALSYGTLHILQEMRLAGHSDIQSIVICGGLSRNKLFVQTQADVAGLPVLLPKEPESVMLGAAILGACAAGVYPEITTAAKAMSGPAEVLKPRDLEHRYHQRKYKVFLKMLEDQRAYKEVMSLRSMI